MLVVSDASPINVLVRIGHIDILPRLFDGVVIPTAVADEMSRDATPPEVRAWLASKPEWLEVRSPTQPADSSLPRHRGEREAIQLALELQAHLLLVDERRPRRLAMSLGIAVVGTVGILERAAALHLMDLEAALARLKQTDFYLSDKLLLETVRRHRERTARDRPPDHPPLSGDV